MTYKSSKGAGENVDGAFKYERFNPAYEVSEGRKI